MRSLRPLLLLSCLCFADMLPMASLLLPRLLVPAQAQPQAVDRFAEAAFAAFEAVPGMGLAVVRGDEVLLLRGFGQREVAPAHPVTPGTGFYIASSTKSFLGLAAAHLDAQGRIDLDAPLAELLPTLELPPPLSPAEITLRDLLTHRHRIFSRDAQLHLAFEGDLTLAAFLDLMYEDLRVAPPGFIYSNIGYNLAGYALEAATGASWQRLVQQAVLHPLGLSATSTSIEQAARGNFAFPYQYDGATFERLAIKSDATMHAAGGLVASVADLARWVQANLQQGRLQGEQRLPRAVFEDAHHPRQPLDAQFFTFRRKAYGLGWYHADFAGENLVHHFGGFDGYQAHISFMPEHDLGVVVVTNATAHGAALLPHLVAAYAYEKLLGKPEVDTRYQAQLDERAAQVHARLRLAQGLAHAIALMDDDPETATTRLQASLEAGLAARVLSQRAINNLGYEHFGNGALQVSLAIFAFNTQAFPEAANPHDSYGEALEAAGRLEEAERAYARAVALTDASDRDHATFQRNLQRVREKRQADH